LSRGESGSDVPNKGLAITYCYTSTNLEATIDREGIESIVYLRKEIEKTTGNRDKSIEQS